MENFDAVIIDTVEAGPSLPARCTSEGLKLPLRGIASVEPVLTQ